MASTAPSPPSLRPCRWGWRLTGGLAVAALLAGAIAYHQRQVIGARLLQSWLRDQGVEGEVVFSALGPDRLTGALRIGPRSKPDLTVDLAEVGYSLHGPWDGRPLGADLRQVRLIRPVLNGEWREGAPHFGGLDPLIQKLLSQPRNPNRPLPDLALEGGRIALTTPYGTFDGSGSGVAKAGRLVRLDVNLGPSQAEAKGFSARLSGAELHLVHKDDRFLWAGDLHVGELRRKDLGLKGVTLRLTGETPYPDLKTGRADGAASLVLTSAIQDLTSSKIRAQSLNQTTHFDGVIANRTAKGQIQTAFSTGVLAPAKDLVLEKVTGAFSGHGQVSADSLALTLDGAAQTRGALSKRPFSLQAPNQHLTLAASKTFALDGRGPLRLASEGIRADLSLDRYHLGPAGLTAAGRVKAEGSLGPIKDGSAALSGRLTAANGLVKVIADGCGPVSAKQFALGANPVTDLAAEICPSRIEATPSGFFLEGGYRRLAVRSPSFDVALSDGEGRFASQGPNLTFKTDVSRMKVTDLAVARRFKPVFATGTLSGSQKAFAGAFKVTDPNARSLAGVTLQQSEGAGGAIIDTGDLVFAEDGLQPRDISPLAASLGSPVTGQVRFKGDLAWKGEELVSHGAIDIQTLNFVSAAGAVKGLTGEVVLSRLSPVQAAPGQTLHVDSVASLTALTNADVKFGLDHDALQVEATGFGLAGGRVTLEPFEIPLAANAPWSVVANLKGVQLSDLVEASPFADRMDLTAKVDGHIPLSFRKGTVQVAGGELHAVEPGRLSIRRDALGQVAASGGPAKPAAPTEVDPYSDFAFQALENLAFTELDAKVDSQADGRLGVRFHIKGEHSPPVSPEIRLTLRELLTQKIKRTLPLPKGVKVDLSLDTSVNLDQLLDDFDKYQSLRNSAPVQP